MSLTEALEISQPTATGDNPALPIYYSELLGTTALAFSVVTSRSDTKGIERSSWVSGKSPLSLFDGSGPAALAKRMLRATMLSDSAELEGGLATPQRNSLGVTYAVILMRQEGSALKKYVVIQIPQPGSSLGPEVWQLPSSWPQARVQSAPFISSGMQRPTESQVVALAKNMYDSILQPPPPGNAADYNLLTGLL